MSLFLPLISLWFSVCSFFFFVLSPLSFYLSFLSFFPLSSFFTIHKYPFLYYLSWWYLPFLPLNCIWLLMGVLPGLPTSLPATQPLPLLRVCWLHHSPFLDKIACFVFTSLCFHFTPPDKDLALFLSHHLPIWHASNGPSPYLPLLGEMPS